VLVQNAETRDWLPSDARRKVAIFPNALFEDDSPASVPRPHRPPTALFAGRLVPWKGAALAVQAIAQCPGWRLVICGEGPDLDRLRRLAGRLGIADRVTFDGWLPREEILRILREETDVLLFPSLHDEGGWAVAEAVSAGIPVVCLDRGGPPVLGGHAVATSGERATVAALAEATMSVRGTRPSAVDARDLEATRRRLVALLEERHLLPATERIGL
jgi:glycosyltransferase involved in cell wall biosynthesis